VYAYLQRGDDSAARAQVDYLTAITDVSPLDGKDAYTFAAAPCRMALENKDWRAAARLSGTPPAFPWEKFPWQEAIIHFGKLLGSAHSGDLHAAEMQLLRLGALQAELLDQKDAYKARQVEIQKTAGKAWIAHVKGANAEAVGLMKKAADWEDSTSKHPVTPGEVLPARELYADLLFDLRQYGAALREYLAVLEKCPGRFNALFGAAQSAEQLGDTANANKYYKQLLAMADPRSTRPELNTARGYLQHNLAGG